MLLHNLCLVIFFPPKQNKEINKHCISNYYYINIKKLDIRVVKKRTSVDFLGFLVQS